MEKGFNLQAQELKESVTSILNNSSMPVTIKHFIILDIYNQISVLVSKEIEAERIVFENSLEREN